ncbi:MAG: hypothetical protein WC279_05020 [Sulfurimonas sp.]|jgi:hypothetical protein|uniref:hypothetical protein n=1 Tax=unclassified Sulfurimonas TaxID=2623549 RepID=UPI0008AFC90D|nr:MULTISPECIES: hypothetical protein [unclassified Sulfurimonas]MDO8261087.1 hypothetical protein [Candidatus Magasanikbacteria bacterium]OHE06653.1 MAG: hypothetical protein A2329_01435 [Sulfurimonas sp. RIFOXYB2_FULL_37_5]OHE11356.1 MAG: hypothetical protein A2525_02020 [Sulfurimonas sp. RIFOXYD12_FULL_36_11]OHE12499.1 MAG: hypothetical protein A3J96_04860 [Sulfurimonas sp. RIFOXYC2_FULL_36_7]MBS4067327.1 hypothetical protein [Sulfurimonas sp.]
MYILIPMSSQDAQEAAITKIDDAKSWVQILLEEGEVVEVAFNEDKDGFENFSEVLIVMDDNEYVWPFIELNMMILVAHTQRNIDEIMEAFLFRELNELAY